MPSITKVETQQGTKWRARIRLAAAPDMHRTFDRRKDAAAWAAQKERDVRMSRVLPELLAKEYTVGDVIERAVAAMESEEASRYIRQKQQQLAWWKKEIGNYTLADVKAGVIREALARLRKRRKANTANRYLATIRGVLQEAVDMHGWSNENVARKVKPFAEPQGRVVYLSMAQLARLIRAAMRVTSVPMLLFVLVAISTGGRKNEILGMRWRDVDVENGTAVFHDTKNGERRKAYIKGAALTQLKKHHAKTGHKEFVFQSRFGKRPVCLDAEFRKMRESVGLGDFCIHDLRHCTASYMAMNGATLPEIGTVLGHKTAKATQIYTHLTEAHVENRVEEMAMQTLDEAVAQLGENIMVH